MDRCRGPEGVIYRSGSVRLWSDDGPCDSRSPGVAHVGREEMPAKWHHAGPHTFKPSARRRDAMLNTPYWKSWTEKSSALLQLLDTSQGI